METNLIFNESKNSKKKKLVLLWSALLLEILIAANTCFGAPCFKLQMKDWIDACINVTCPFHAWCVSSMNIKGKYNCECVEECFDVGDSQDNIEVCGTNEVNYHNLCELRQSACKHMVDIQVKYYGKCNPCHNFPCGPQQVCRLNAKRQAYCDCEWKCDETAPHKICASDGRTYPSRCVMEHEACLKGLNLVAIQERPCNGRKERCTHNTCAHPYEQCRLSSGQQPKCICPPPCEEVYEPVCGSNGITYDSICHLKRLACQSGSTIDVGYLGVCGNAGQCGIYNCPSNTICRIINGDAFCVCAICPSLDSNSNSPINQVCGSDDQTYESICWLNRAACRSMFEGLEKRKSANVSSISPRKNVELFLKHKGPCNACSLHDCEAKGRPYAICKLTSSGTPKCHCPDNCIYDGLRVCGSDGKTYLQECDLRRQACLSRHYITKIHDGGCIINPS